MAIQLTDDVHWINPCVDHVHNSVYVITGRSNILIEAGSYLHEERILREIDELTGGSIDAMVITHADVPHTANAKPFARRFDAEIHAAVALPDAQGLFPWGEGNRKIVIGHDHEIEGRAVHAVPATLADRPNSWLMFDYASGVLFTADGFGHYHGDGECDRPFSELPDEDKLANIKRFHQEKLPWLRFVEPRLIRAALESDLEPLDLSYIAPIHGNPVPGASVPAYLDLFERSVEEIAAEYDGPGSGNPALVLE